MDANSVKECSICNHEFDEDQRCPRNLSCGHCLCTNCINQMIVRNEKQCPFCRKVFEARSAQEMAKNIIALDLLKHVRDLEANAAKGTSTSRSEMVNNMKQQSCQMNIQNILSCKEAIAQIKAIKKKNFELSCNISQELVEIRKLEEHNEAKMQFLEKENEKLEQLMTEAEETQQELEKVKVILDEATTISKADSAVDAAEASNTSAESRLQKMNRDMSENEKLNQEIQKNMKTGENQKHFMDILTSVKDSYNIIKHMATMTLQEKPCIKSITEMNASTRYLVSIDGYYAKQEVEGKTRYGRLSISKNRLCMHHLTELNKTPNSWTYKFDEVMNLVDPSSRLTFLEFGNEEVTLGRVYIRLTPDTKRAENFTLLCTGEKGPSYAGTKILDVWEDDFTWIMKCGDYEKNTGEGGKALVQGTGEETNGLLTRTRQVGSVGGWPSDDSKASLFYIIPKVNTDGTYGTIFGIVESGMDVLATATSLYPNMKNDFKITESGIVLTK